MMMMQKPVSQIPLQIIGKRKEPEVSSLPPIIQEPRPRGRPPKSKNKVKRVVSSSQDESSGGESDRDNEDSNSLDDADEER